MPSEDLHRPLKSIDRAIGKVRDHLEQIRGEVEKIRELVEEGFKSVRDAIHENIQAQAELQIIDYMTDVKMKKVQIDAELDQIQDEKDDLDAQLDSISERYADKHAELNETAAERVRDLGEHIFEIKEAEFEDGIEDPYLDHAGTVWKRLEEHNDQVYSERSGELRRALQSFTESARAFLDGQDQLISRIDDHSTDVPVRGNTVEEFQLPYYVVNYREEGEAKTAVVPTSRVVDVDGDWVSAGLEPLAGTRSITRKLADERRQADERERLSPAAVEGALEEFSTGGLTTNYGDALETVLPDEGLPVAREAPAETRSNRGGGD